MPFITWLKPLSLCSFLETPHPGLIVNSPVLLSRLFLKHCSASILPLCSHFPLCLHLVFPSPNKDQLLHNVVKYKNFSIIPL